MVLQKSQGFYSSTMFYYNPEGCVLFVDTNIFRVAKVARLQPLGLCGTIGWI